MYADGDSFLPRIISVFYAVFDNRQGPKIVHQVPEGLIATSASSAAIPPLQTSASSESTNSQEKPTELDPSESLSSPVSKRPGSRPLPSPNKRSVSSNRILFHFDDVSKHRLIGFPMIVAGDYERNQFQFNVGMVFERTADLSSYEPVIRKISRVLTACEEESSFLTRPENSNAIHAILEQLYEDLNSYSETSIPIDEFNSIELKILPFYPNPPDVQDWMVPIALVDFAKRVETNWDLTVAKISAFIDGTNHVSLIAHLAECDLELARQAVAHLLFYQVIMTIDIFQYSNMYTLRKSTQVLANEPNVFTECGPYVTKPGIDVPDWPKLLHLYSRLKPGTTVREWMDTYDVDSLGIDARRFTSFGVIKGFLRRVHRWPVLLPAEETSPSVSSVATPGASVTAVSSPVMSIPSTPDTPGDSPSRQVYFARARGRLTRASTSTASVSMSTEQATRTPSHTSPKGPEQKSSVAEKALEQLRALHVQSSQPSSSKPPSIMTRSNTSGTQSSTTAHRDRAQSKPGREETPSTTRRLSFIEQAYSNTPRYPTAGSAIGRTVVGLQTSPGGLRHRLSDVISPQIPIREKENKEQAEAEEHKYPSVLLALLNGERHTDELSTTFQVGWPTLEEWLIEAGGSKGRGDMGRIVVIYR